MFICVELAKAQRERKKREDTDVHCEDCFNLKIPDG